MNLIDEWVVCINGSGWLSNAGEKEKHSSKFEKNSVGQVKEVYINSVKVWLIGPDEEWEVPLDQIELLDVEKTGDKFENKICNLCFRLLPVSQFDLNQTNLHGVLRRPSCVRCRAGIDKKPPKTKQAKKMEKLRPPKGSAFLCPICRKRSIVGVTAKVVADHDHNTGYIRDFICDSCNTGLGRFKNGESILQNAIHYLEQRSKLS